MNLENELNDLKELLELSKDVSSELDQVKIQINNFEERLELLEEESLLTISPFNKVIFIDLFS